jgi:Tfp pilus assembly protein PilN
MNQYEMVAVIVVAVMLASVLRAKFGYSRRSGRIAPQEQAENLRLREEVKELKERLHVLERIATDKESSLAREIEDLRDR